MIPRAVLDAIYAHARETYPEECCGFVFDGEALRVQNRQNELHARDPQQFPRDAKTAYNMGPKDIRALEQSFKTERPVRMIYHSHCGVGAYFSAEDKRAATWDGEPLYPGVDYLVVDVQQDGVRGAKLFRFQDGDFVQVEEFPA
jgi:[CysO sulfur-carrier protein]-S-L-cysteine hydrolase